MSISNNIAEGSGSNSKKEFRQFLNIARRSTFENANILILWEMRSLISKEFWETFRQTWLSMPSDYKFSKNLKIDNILRFALCVMHFSS